VLFREQRIDRWRVLDGSVPPLVRVVVAVDPSGAGDTDNADNDEIGLVVVGLGQDGAAYLLEDCTLKAGPATWGRVAVQAYMRHQADAIVGEVNFGGAMVQSTVAVAAAALGTRAPFRKVTASRGKVQRAEPFSALYEGGKVRHVGMFPSLEDELAAFSTSGYTGADSPNRADALIWALAELFPSMTAPKSDSEGWTPSPMVSPYSRR
jgi:predicted phage terminase large subunit-like protein